MASEPLSDSTLNGTSGPNMTGVWHRRARWLTWALVAFGVALRVIRYWQDQSPWTDEGHLMANIVGRDFWELTKPLDLEQAAPVGYLWLVKGLMAVLGPRELVMELPSILAGVGSMVLTYLIGRRFLSPAALMVALLGVGTCEWLIYYSSEIKPYSLDACLCLLVMWLTLRFDQKPGAWWLVWLTVAAMGVSWLSIPGIIVSGLCGLVMFKRAWEMPWVRLGVAGATAAVLANIGMIYYLTLSNVAGKEFYYRFWAKGFPPSYKPVELASWLGVSVWAFLLETVGLEPVQSVLALCLCAAGLVSFRYRNRFARRQRALVLVAGCFGAALAFSLARLYPLTPNVITNIAHPTLGRLQLWLIPPLFLLIGTGLDCLARQVKTPRGKAVLFVVLGAVLLGPAVFGAVKHVAKPPEPQDFKNLWGRLAAQMEEGDAVYLQSDAYGLWLYYDQVYPHAVKPTYFALFRWNNTADEHNVKFGKFGAFKRLWVVNIHCGFWKSHEQEALLDEMLSGSLTRVSRINDLAGVNATVYTWKSRKPTGK